MADAPDADWRQEAVAGGEVWRDVHVTVQDGLRIHAREYGERGPHLPVVCLPGLTRNCRDFHELAVFVSTRRHRPRRVLSIDFRGRGSSDYDRNWRNYTPLVEMADVLDMLTACGIDEACFVGTSRGGLVTMLLAASRPTAIRAAVLNDIGPEIEGTGLLRIKNVLSATKAPDSWNQATDMLRRAYESQFPALDGTAWDNYARKTFADRDGKPIRDYDPKLLKTFESIDFDQPLATMWPQFDGLASIPLMVMRGDRSDILSEDTLAEMAERRDETEIITVEDAGHAPMLIEMPVLNRISAFITAAEHRRL